MVDFSVPAHPQSTRTTPASTDAGMTLSDILADHTAPTGGTLQHPHSTGPLAIDSYLTSTYPWIFVNYSLPLRATSETMWERTDGDVTVILAATPYEDADGTTQYHLPSGRIAREVIMYLVTSAMMSGSPTIEISRTWRGFLRDMGVPYSSANRRAVERQLRAILNMSVRVSHRTAHASGTNLSSRACLVGSGENLVFDRDGVLDDAYRSVVILSDEFFDRIAAAPSPVHGTMRVLRDSWRQIVTENPHQALAGDVYLWLAGRMSRVRREVRIPWADLAAQFGSSMSNERRWRQQFRSALSVATRAYFAPLGEDFDSTVYVGEYDLGSRNHPGGLRLAPVSAEHRKLLGWSTSRSRRTSTRTTPARQKSQPAPAASAAPSPEVVSIPAHAGVDVAELRAALDAAGLPTGTVSDGTLRAAIDTVLERAKVTPGSPQAFVRVCILREPALLTGTATPVAPAVQAPTAPAAPSQGAAPLISGRPVLPVAPCPVHGQDVTGLVCRDCAVELKSADTDPASAESCWRAVRARLTELSRLDGVDTSGEWVRYSSLAAAHGVDA
ncbi:replication protein RepA [Rothia mucilaginosa]|uniref:replication protein RepA n=1 Tax=Rothia mucilaginosa TaxID=43675 RepID=UPI0028DBBC90|nr:replication protein RepA [Rothia mucilaginosa]